MLKHIPKSDINYRPFKVYKTFNLTETDITASLAFNHTGSTDTLSQIELNQQGLYHQLYSMYYRDPHNPFTSYGDIIPISESYNSTNSQRYLSGSAYVLPIPQKMYGEGIKPGSVILNSNISGDYSMDDSYGNLISDTNIFTLISLNIQDGTFTFLDSIGTQNTLSFNSININDETITIVGQTNTFTKFSANIQNNNITFVGIIEGNPNINKRTIGNVIYSHGLIIVTKDVLGNNLGYFDNYDLEYKSTTTIYENEILLVVGEDEFNVSTNKSSQIEINGSMFQSPLFADYMYSSSVDPTGSYLAPYITTIGLYDENMDMVAVAKLATPVKSTPDLPVNFLVRFDT
jgi:hypothetical protein